MKAALFTMIALIAFAANSLLCRMALADGAIDAWNFTVIRLLSAAACLGLIMLLQAYFLRRNRLRRNGPKQTGSIDKPVLKDKGDWFSSLCLVI